MHLLHTAHINYKLSLNSLNAYDLTSVQINEYINTFYLLNNLYFKCTMTTTL